MKHINKQPEPEKFAKWRIKNWKRIKKAKSAKKRWELLPKDEKEVLVSSLISEQGYICAYCNSRVDNSKSVKAYKQEFKEAYQNEYEKEHDELKEDKNSEYFRKINEYHVIVEHIDPKGIKKPDNSHIKLAFDYTNLAICCGGEQNRRPRKETNLHCDHKKGAQTIEIKPTDENCEKVFKFYTNGRIEGLSDQSNRTIEVLGLNADILIDRRKETILGLFFQANTTDNSFFLEPIEPIELIEKDEADVIYSKLTAGNQAQFEEFWSALTYIYRAFYR